MKRLLKFTEIALGSKEEIQEYVVALLKYLHTP